MRKPFLTIFLTLSASAFGNDLDKAKNQGEKFSEQSTFNGWDNVNNFANDLTPESDRGKEFNPRKAKRQVKNEDFPPSEILEHLRSEAVQANTRRSQQFIDEEEGIFKEGNSFIQFSDEPMEEKTEFTIEKCIQSSSVYPLMLKNQLTVEVKHQPAIKRQVKICSGHSQTREYYWKSDAEKAKRKEEDSLQSNSTIKDYSVKIHGGGTFSDYKVKSHWWHVDDTDICNSFNSEERILKKEKYEETDHWSFDNKEKQDLADSPQCTFVNKECLDATPTKIIKGKEVSRQCWLEKLNYLCFEEKKECPFLKQKNCQLIEKNCLKKESEGCTSWELIFKCTSKLSRNFGHFGSEAYGLKKDDWDTSYTANSSFSSILSTLSLFDEIKKELEASQAFDATKVNLFGGKKFQCSKSKAENVMYDCCFAYSGLAKEATLAHCTTDEISLADLRERGLCHYIGSYDEKFHKLWKSRKEHVYCCFPSKLSRIFQEQARSQIHLGWGKPKKPLCRGLTQEEITRIDFTKLDLSDAFEQEVSFSNLKDRMDSVESNLKKRLEEI